MCLFTKEFKPKIAKHNIKVWKVIYKDGGVYRTSERKSPLMEVPAQHAFDIEKLENYITVGGGAIHAYTDRDTANSHLSFRTAVNYMFKRDEDLFIIEGIVPKGTEYFINENGKQIATKRVLFDPKYIQNKNMFKRLSFWIESVLSRKY